MQSPSTRGLLTNTPKSKDTMITWSSPIERGLSILTDRTPSMAWERLNSSTTFYDGASLSSRKSELLTCFECIGAV